MNGFIANTDPDWHSLLLGFQRSGRPVREVNFWRPSDNKAFRSLVPGEPVLFRLKSPSNAIGGFGYFQTFSIQPSWLAWETFGVGNGVTSLPELDARLSTIRSRNRIVRSGELRIGCILLIDPVFFDRDEWVTLPVDWKANIVAGKRYDLATTEGARVWAECLARGERHDAPLAREIQTPVDRYGAPMFVRPRLGQCGFRIAVMDAYGGACAVTTEHSLPVLEAAHIRPYAEEGEHAVTNGLLLRSDIHRLFDRGYVTVTPDYQFRVSRRLNDDFANGKTYYALEGRPIALPGSKILAPSRAALSWHANERFLG